MRLSQRAKTVKILYLIGLIVLAVLFLTAPDIGKSILFYKFAIAIAFLIWGILCLALLIINMLQKRKEYKRDPDNQADDFEDTFHKTFGNFDFKGIATLLFGILLIGVSAIQMPDCIKDFNAGTTEIVLINTSAEYHRSTSTRGFSRKYYSLKGTELSTGENYKFRFERLSESVVNALNHDFTKVEMVIYPNTKAVVSMEIHCTDKTIILPGEQIVVKEDVSEEIETEPLNPEDYDLPDYEIGSDYRDFMQNMNSYTFSKGFWLRHEIVTPDNMEYMQIKEQELKDAYDIPDDCTYAIYYKSEIEMIVVYQKESFEIVDVLVRPIEESL